MSSEANARTDGEPRFGRQKERGGPVPVEVRFYQSIGALPDTLKNFAFSTFLLFYYNQVMGLSGSLTSLAIFIALVIDAITDPIVGSWSDTLRTRLGRRHPPMYGAVLPLGLMLWMVFSPPAGMSDAALFAWLLVGAVGTRVAMTFFILPWNALFTEFSDDYVERTSIVTWRYLMGVVGGTSFAFLTWTLIFPSTPEFTPGHLNPEAYGRFAPILALCVAGAALLTTHLTRNQVPFLMQPIGRPQRLGPRAVVDEVLMALRNRDFLVLALGIFAVAAVGGTGGALEIYMTTYFWGLLPEQIRWFSFASLGMLIGIAIVPLLQRWMDKRTLLIGAILVNLVNEILLVTLRLLDLLPAPGSNGVLMVLLGYTVVRTAITAIAGVMFVSMVADVLDAQELRTRRRQEGVFSASLSLAAKFTAGIGVMVAGLLLDYAIGFPRGARPSEVDPDILFRLGVVAYIVVPLFILVPALLFSRYSITREVHERIRVDLQRQRAAPS